MTEEELRLIIKAVDQGASKVAREVGGDVKKIGTEATGAARLVDRLTGSLRGLGGWIKAGFGIGIGVEIFRGIEDGLSAAVRAFEGAITGGQAWAQTVRDIERVTGMTAQQASEFAAVLGRIGAPLGNIQQLLAQTGRSLLENEDLWKRAGIATRDANGNMLTAYTVLQNLRRAVSEHSAALQASGLVQELVGRNGTKGLLEFLQLTNEEYTKLAREAGAAGQIINEQQARQAEVLGRLQDKVQGTITGIQSAIFQDLAPVLQDFVAQFAAWVDAHMREIVTFVVNVANLITGVIGGLFGFDFSVKAAADATDAAADAADTAKLSYSDWLKQIADTAKGEDALTTSLNGQIRAVDRQIDAINRRIAARHAEQQAEQLILSLAQARSQLADLRGATPYTAGLSNAEQVLAQQKHAQDIADAEQDVSDRKNDLALFNADAADRREVDALQRKKQRLQDELTAHRKAVQLKAAYDDYLTSLEQKNDQTAAASSKSLYAQMTADGQEWRDKGVRFADDLKKAVKAVTDAVLGPEVVDVHPGGTSSYRTGGLLGALFDVERAFQHVADAADFVRDPLGWFVDDLKKFAQWLIDAKNSVFGWVPNWSPPGQAGHATGGRVKGGRPVKVGEIGSEWFIPDTDGRIQPTSATGGPGMPMQPVNLTIQVDGYELFRIIDRRLYLATGNVPVGMPGFRG